MRSHSLLLGIFWTQGSNPGSPALQADSLPPRPLGKPREVVQGSNVTTHVKWLSLTGPEETLNSKFPFGHFYRRRWHRVSNLSLLNSLWNLPVQHRYTPHYIPHSCRHTSSGWFQPCTFPSLSSGHLWPDAVPPWCNAWGSTQIPRYGLISAGETKWFLHFGPGTTILFSQAKMSLRFCFAMFCLVKKPQLAVDSYSAPSQRKPQSLIFPRVILLNHFSPSQILDGCLLF